MATTVDPYSQVPAGAPIGEATAAADPSVAIMRAAEAKRQRDLQSFQQEQELKAAQEQRTKASAALAQAHDSHVVAQDQAAASTHAMANDLGQWSQDVANPQYRVPWDQAPDEVKTHVQQAYGDQPGHVGVASAAPKVWNDAYTANTGNVVTPRVPASGAHKIAAQKAGVPVEPDDTDDSLVAKMAAKQAAEAIPPNNGQPGEGALEGMNEDEANMVRQIANYDLPVTALSRLPAPQKMRILGRVSQFDPTFSANEYPARQSLKTSVKAGPISENIKAANTAVAHLNTLLQSANSLNNTNYPIINKAGNFVATQMGAAGPTNFDTARNAVVAELSKVFKGQGMVPVSEINHWRDVMNSSQSPEQIKEGVRMALELMGGRFGAIQDQYERGMGRPKDFSILTPKSRAILRTNGFDPDQIEGGTPPQEDVNAPNPGQPSQPAQIPTVNSQKEYDALPSGAQYRDSNGKTARKK